jgi:hypothetical protein
MARYGGFGWNGAHLRKLPLIRFSSEIYPHLGRSILFTGLQFSLVSSKLARHFTSTLVILLGAIACSHNTKMKINKVVQTVLQNKVHWSYHGGLVLNSILVASAFCCWTSYSTSYGRGVRVSVVRVLKLRIVSHFCSYNYLL